MMRLGLQENIFTGWDFISGGSLAEKFGKIEDFGFDAIELWGWDVSPDRLKDVKSALSSTNLKCSTICGGYKGDLLGAERKSRELAVEEIKDRLKACAELGCLGQIIIDRSMDFSINASPRIPDLWPWNSDVHEIEKRVLIEECKILGRSAKDFGAFIIIEPINRHTTDFLNRLDQAVEICNATENEKVKVMADFYHMNIEEANIAQSLRKAAKSIVHVHLKDSNGQLPGLGHIDFKEGINVLKECRYGNCLTMECEVHSEIDLKTSVKYVRQML
jgi:sugar phosphate isomerase/epimerase